MDQDGIAAVQEAIRRRAGLGGSAAGISGGAQAANANTPANPLAAAGAIPQQPAPQGAAPPAPTADNPLSGAASMLKSAQPNSETMIIKYLGDHLKRLGEAGAQQPLQMI